jgi:hypothetical protein
LLRKGDRVAMQEVIPAISKKEPTETDNKTLIKLKSLLSELEKIHTYMQS